jgi:hypothetical protein
MGGTAMASARFLDAVEYVQSSWRLHDGQNGMLTPAFLADDVQKPL